MSQTTSIMRVYFCSLSLLLAMAANGACHLQHCGALQGLKWIRHPPASLCLYPFAQRFSPLSLTWHACVGGYRHFHSYKLTGAQGGAEDAAAQTGGITVEEASGEMFLYRGQPGPICGHAVVASSYFDRLWKTGASKSASASVRICQANAHLHACTCGRCLRVDACWGAGGRKGGWGPQHACGLNVRSILAYE